jgi:hypothetical protein
VTSSAPLDPYAAPAKPFNEVSAASPSSKPANSKGSNAPGATPKRATVTTKPALAGTGKTNAGAKPKAPAPAAPLIEKRKISRKDLDAALSDFYTLGKEAKLELIGSGVRIAGVARGSFFDRVGLESGDVIDKVAGKRVRDADDGALIYVELTSAKSFTVDLDRGGVPVTLQFTVTR